MTPLRLCFSSTSSLVIRAVLSGTPARVSCPCPAAAAAPRLTARSIGNVRCCASLPVSSAMPAAGLLEVLRDRGLLDNVTGTAAEALDGADPRVSASSAVVPEAVANRSAVYCGFDPTADSLHLGNLLAIIALAWCQRCGHKPVAIIGGATGRVGDPSGKSVERPVLSDETIDRNLRGIQANIVQVLKRSAEQVREETGQDVPELVVLNNADWWRQLSFLDVLRDIGKHARMSTMLAKDSVKTRLDSEEGMSYTEFSYQLLQAYDFMYLSDHHGVGIQMGGSDQWGNITAGVELTRKLRDGRPLTGITFPLLTTADGRKFGKSEKGAVWLTESKLSPYEFYQHLFKVPDVDVIRFLKRLTFLSLDEIEKIEATMTTLEYVPNTAQRRLAEEVTRIVHGDEGVRVAQAATAVANPGGSAALSADALEAVAQDMPSASLGRSEVVGKALVDVMVAAGLQKSKGEARRLIIGGGGYLNNAKVDSEKRLVSDEDLVDSRLLLLGAGKKKKLLVRISS